MRVRGATIATIATIAATVVAVIVAGCTGESDPTGVTPSDPHAPVVLLKDVEIPGLPAPYYHFEYDAAGQLRLASFASGLTSYDVMYGGGRITELDNHTAGNQDRLAYIYDDAGRVASVRYLDASGQVSTRLFLSYAGAQLTAVERDRRVTGGFIIDKTMAFSYFPDGNVREIAEHRPAIDGVQAATTVVDRYDHYDGGINVDAFGLLHTEFFDHLVLLPGVRLQRGNPGTVTHTGDGSEYTVEYTYAYDASGRPSTKSGALTFTSGPDAGRRFQTLSRFSYYEPAALR